MLPADEGVCSQSSEGTARPCAASAGRRPRAKTIALEAQPALPQSIQSCSFPFLILYRLRQCVSTARPDLAEVCVTPASKGNECGGSGPPLWGLAARAWAPAPTLSSPVGVNIPVPWLPRL